jgi:uncharacterized small protein (DUF1192 family)
MSPPANLDDLSHTELKNLVVALFEQVAELRRTIAAQAEEIARLKAILARRARVTFPLRREPDARFRR